MKANRVPFSVYGVPLLGLVGLLVCLWHPQTNVRPGAAGTDVIYMVTPSPKLDKSMTVFLKQEAKNVAESRRSHSLGDQAQTIENYNLIAQECTPAVFQKTHLPSSL